MGHISHEPSMEEILSSIKRIIAEDDAPPSRAAKKPQAKAAKLVQPAPEPEILELTETVDPLPADEPAPVAAVEPAGELPQMILPDDEILSIATATATRSALASLSRLKVRAEDGVPENSLEGLVRDMLRPMLKEWLDANLPGIVESMVSKEIQRISGGAL
jgi:cell pole-organizing protein PopZ